MFLKKLFNAKKKINPSWDSYSIADKTGRVFLYRGEVYRAISSGYENYMSQLINSEMFHELVDKKWFPRTTEANVVVPGYPLVLKHEKVQVSRQTEWSFSMLKDACIFLLRFERTLNEHGYKLWDGHLYNVLFHHNKPIYIDLGSIVSSSTQTCFKNEFLYLSVYPLIMAAMNERFLSASVLAYRNYMRTIPTQNIDGSKAVDEIIHRFFEKIKQPYDINKLYDPEFIEKFVNPIKETSMWSDYQQDFFDENNLERFARFDKITDYIKRYCTHATSITDLAGNQGALLYALDKKFPCQYKNLINLDYDENAIEFSYKNLKERKSNVSTFLMNFMLPKSYVYPDFKSDIVLALAITHHLILTQGFHIDAIFEQVGRFSKKYVFIEFMPLGLWNGETAPELPDWYNEKWFKKHFEKYFHLEHIDRYEKNRTLFIGTIRKK